jgi:AcrR family transcriptional regulator
MGRPPKITNEEILAAARQVFLEHGSNVSTLAIAEKAGISEAAIFKRFATKQTLFLAAMGITEVREWVNRLSNSTPTAAIKAELIEICGKMLDFYLEVMPRVFMMMTHSNSPHPPVVPPPPVRDTQLLAGYLDRAIAQGHLKPCDTITVAHLIVGAMTHYVVTQNIAGKWPMATPLPTIQPLAIVPLAIEPSTFIHNLIETLWIGIAVTT